MLVLSSDSKYLLSNGLIQLWNSLHALNMNILRSLWIYFVGMSHLPIVWCWFAITYVSPFFLCLKECIVNWKFGSIVSCGLTRETRLTKYRPIAYRTCLLDWMKCSTLDGDSFTWWHLSGENEVLHGRIVVCLSQEQLGYSIKYIIHWNWDIKTS